MRCCLLSPCVFTVPTVTTRALLRCCRDVQQQLVDREREAEILEAEVAELTRFLDSLVSGPASCDKVAEMLDRELKAARKRVNKLTRDCQVLQDMLYAKSMEMARWGQVPASAA